MLHTAHQAYELDLPTQVHIPSASQNGLEPNSDSFRIFYTMLEGFLMKYVWSGIGMAMIAVPVFINARYEKDAGQYSVSSVAE